MRLKPTSSAIWRKTRTASGKSLRPCAYISPIFTDDQVFERGRGYITRWIDAAWIRISDAPLYRSTITSLSASLDFVQQHGAAATRYLENSPSIDPTEEALRVYENQTI
jgi:hypothetical protein